MAITAPKNLIKDLRKLIVQARQDVARTVNSSLVMLYWRIGRRIEIEVLREKRAEYGEEIVATVSRQLTGEFGPGFGEKSLRRMIQFVQVFKDEPIVSTLSTQLGWSHFVEIIPLKDELQREFYAEMCRVERWSIRQLRQKIGALLYERTAISKKPAGIIKQELVALREQD